MNMNRIVVWLFVLAVLSISPNAFATTKDEVDCDVVVYGATPAGIASAITLARRNERWRVLLVTPYKRVGGLITNGLTHPDFRTFEARTGLFREFNRRVEQHYRERFGADSQQVKDSLLGTHAGPDVNHTVFREMLDLPGIAIRFEHRLKSVTKVSDHVQSVSLDAADGSVAISGKYFVDASYEGDLMAAAGVPFHVGREASSQYGESLAPKTADSQVQGYSFRLTMTDVAENRAPVPEPEGYDRSEYLPLLELLKNGSITRIFGDPFAGPKGGNPNRDLVAFG